jgi:hypothetical protein
MFDSIKSWLPIKDIREGIIICDTHCCKILEITPINFKLRSKSEQENILYQYKNFLKMCNFDIQILIKSKRSDVEEYLKNIEAIYKAEKSECLKEIMLDYIKNIKDEILIKKSISRRFFMIIKYDIPKKDRKREINMEEFLSGFDEKILKIKNTLSKCGNQVIDFGRDNKKIIKLVYEELNKNISQIQKIDDFTKWEGIV